MSLGPDGWAMLVVGATLLVVGVVSLARVRQSITSGERSDTTDDEQAGVEAPDEARADARATPGPRLASAAASGVEAGVDAGVPWSAASRVAVGAAMSLVGYHLVVWTLPPGTTSVMIGAPWWWCVLLGAVAMVTLSRAIDRIDPTNAPQARARPRTNTPPNDARERGTGA